VAAGAEEVGVDGAFAVLGVVRQEAGVAQATGGGLEVVVVEALPLAVAVGVQDVLDLLPGGGVHQRLVPAGVLHALEGHYSAVVGVVQQGVQSSSGDGFGRQVQPQAGQVRRRLRHRPVAGGVLGEGQPDKGCPRLIQRHGTHFPPALAEVRAPFPGLYSLR